MVFTAMVLVAGCSAGPTSTDAPAAATANAGSDFSPASLVAALRSAGLAVQDAGTVQQPFYRVPAHVYQVDGRDLQVYEFGSSAEAEQAAAQVAPDGGSIGTSMMTWMAPPHFFRKDRLVVNYIGTSAETLAVLERILGPQFAGRS